MTPEELAQHITHVRHLIGDVDPANVVIDDALLTSYLQLEGYDVRLAAADALDVIASSEAMVGKVIRTQDLSTDGTKVAAALRAHADRLRSQAGSADAADIFDIVDTLGTSGTLRPERTARVVWGL